MASPVKAKAGTNRPRLDSRDAVIEEADEEVDEEDEEDFEDEDQDKTARLEFEADRQPQHAETPDSPTELLNGGSLATSSPPQMPDSFDWGDFEARYQQALEEADEREKEILKEAEAFSKYFQVWASAASAHDDERAAKRLQTRQRFVNLSEENMAQKKQHYEEVLRAFESALALLRTT